MPTPKNPIERLKAIPGLSAWVVSSRRTRREEIYFRRNETESRRSVENLGGRVDLFTTNGDRTGRGSFDIQAGDPAAFDRQIEKAMTLARLGSELPFPLAGKSEYGKVYLLDPEARDSLETMPSRARAAIQEGVGRTRDVRLAAAEVFVTKTNTAVINSAGAAAENDESSYFVEVVLMAGSGAGEQEHQARWRKRRFEDLDLATAVQREGERAIDRLSAVKPSAGATPVVFGPELLGDMIAFLVPLASGASAFRKDGALTIGEPIAELGADAGDPLIVELDALFPFGPLSYRIDALGTAGTNVRIIENGTFVRPHADAQFAHYLKLDRATGAPGTPQLPLGKLASADLRRDRYLEIVSVSDLVPSRGSGRFSAEIRLGYEVTGSTRRPVAGGTLTGNVFEVLSRARWSKEVSLHDRYVGPDLARVESGLTVVA
ncbi:MAG: metallopeptidase TldD-related protein [Candidatus Eisenbacteria bacterium]|nr:metallopeptidase TldD-related protein [Candidatus Eisenbacteria bacterium]